MEPLYKSAKNYVESGEYFIDALKWYKSKYINPFCHRSLLFILSSIVLALFFSIVLNINSLLPMVTSVRYSTNTNSSENKSAQIIRVNHENSDPLASIAEIMIQNYVSQRETYDYNNLKKQFIYIKNTSTRMVFRRFYNYMNINNPSSPVLLYQKDIIRSYYFISSSFLASTRSKVKFQSIAKDNTGEIFENKIWEVIVDYEIEPINTALPDGSRFNFTVTDYQLKLLEDKKNK
jgi:type IV secretion system protein VirB8